MLKLDVLAWYSTDSKLLPDVAIDGGRRRVLVRDWVTGHR